MQLCERLSGTERAKFSCLKKEITDAFTDILQRVAMAESHGTMGVVVTRKNQIVRDILLEKALKESESS